MGEYGRERDGWMDALLVFFFLLLFIYFLSLKKACYRNVWLFIALLQNNISIASY